MARDDVFPVGPVLDRMLESAYLLAMATVRAHRVDGSMTGPAGG